MVDVSDVDRQRMDEMTARLPSKSAKIRRLAAAGYARADIARYLGIRYQFVYNVLAAPPPKTGDIPDVAAGGRARKTAGAQATPRPAWAVVRKDGAIDLPNAFLEALGVGDGDQVQISLHEGAVRILSRDAAIRDVQAMVRRHVPEGISLVEDLIAERRAEAAKEDARDG